MTVAGWLGLNGTRVADPEEAFGRLVSNRGAADTTVVNADRSAGVRGVGGNVFADAEVAIALDGVPYWSDPEFADFESREGPARAAARCYQRYGRGLLDRLHGPFALAATRREDRSILLAVDRVGTRPLAYRRLGGGVVFSSCAEGVARFTGEAPAIRVQSVYDYFYAHCVPSPGTIFEGVEKLLPGQCVEFRNGGESADLYWKPAYDDAVADPLPSLAEELRTVLAGAVTRCAMADDVGAFLSGGTDSSTLVGMLAADPDARPVRAFSIGFDVPGFDETAYARIAARHFGAEHHEYVVTAADVAAAVSVIAEAYDEPFGNASAVPTLYCARMAEAAGIRTLLAGDGGDELFGGNARYAKQLLFERYAALPDTFRSLTEGALLGSTLGRSLAPVRKARSFVEQARVPLPDRLETYNFLHRDDPGSIFAEEFLAAVDTDAPSQVNRWFYAQSGAASSLNRLLFLDLKTTLADNDLRKVNRMCDVAGVSVAYPMLDDAVVAFSARVPSRWKIRRGRLRYFFKYALRDFLPPETLRKPKQGFGLPFGIWLESDRRLEALARDSLDSLCRRGFLRRSYVERIWAAHREEHSSYFGVMIWVATMLEQWLTCRKL